jgi:UDP-N-acetylglucosamine 4-epimerase
VSAGAGGDSADRNTRVRAELARNPRRWLVTGVAGFIGSNLLETLLALGQDVVGLDNFATGHRRNLEEVRLRAPEGAWSRFRFVEGDIRNAETCAAVCESADVVLHQAALGSVPRSLADPVATDSVNVGGFLNMLVAARDARVGRFVFAASSSTYGDHAALPKVEAVIGRPLSPYAVTKVVNELYAAVFARSYGFASVGLRYFNVFGGRQDPEGPYAAVIPKWIISMLRHEPVDINGDGETSRDFCFIDNVVQANLLAAVAEQDPGASEIFNVAVGESTSLNCLYELLRLRVTQSLPQLQVAPPRYRAFRKGDVRHSLADIGKARERLGYRPTHSVADGLTAAMPWYISTFADALPVREGLAADR